MKEAESGFVFAETTKALSFSSIPVQLALWWCVRTHLVVIYFGKTHSSPGMGKKVPGKKNLLHAGALPECPRPPTGCKAMQLRRGQSCTGQFTSAEDPALGVIKDMVEKNLL